MAQYAIMQFAHRENTKIIRKIKGLVIFQGRT
jgi:hypothetical protein